MKHWTLICFRRAMYCTMYVWGCPVRLLSDPSFPPALFTPKLHGAAYGKGIYLSPISSISFGYSGRNSSVLASHFPFRLHPFLCPPCPLRTLCVLWHGLKCHPGTPHRFFSFFFCTLGRFPCFPVVQLFVCCVSTPGAGASGPLIWACVPPLILNIIMWLCENEAVSGSCVCFFVLCQAYHGVFFPGDLGISLPFLPTFRSWFWWSAII